jgi:hypothetical protein
VEAPPTTRAEGASDQPPEQRNRRQASILNSDVPPGTTRVGVMTLASLIGLVHGAGDWIISNKLAGSAARPLL